MNYYKFSIYYAISVDGGLSAWSAFSKCSRSCGAGHTHRTRACTNPSPAHGGKNCKAVLKETKTCKIKECPGLLL